MGKKLAVVVTGATGQQGGPLALHRSPVHLLPVPLDVIRQRMGEDGAKMYEWFDRVGYTVDRAALRREFPDVLGEGGGLERASAERLDALSEGEHHAHRQRSLACLDHSRGRSRCMWRPLLRRMARRCRQPLCKDRPQTKRREPPS